MRTNGALSWYPLLLTGGLAPFARAERVMSLVVARPAAWVKVIA
jgi:hypothetical protein